MDYYGKDTGYTPGEMHALIAPLFGRKLDPAEIYTGLVLAVTHDGRVLLSSDAAGATHVFDLLTAGQVELVRRMGKAAELGELSERPADSPNPLEHVPADTEALLRAIFPDYE